MDFLKISKAEQIVTGIVYSSTPDGEAPRLDSQGDWIRMSVLKEEMERLNTESEHICFDCQHSGGKCMLFPIISQFMVEQDMRYQGKNLQKGDYIMSIKVDDPTTWQKIEQGILTGFSIAGWAMS